MASLLRRFLSIFNFCQSAEIGKNLALESGETYNHLEVTTSTTMTTKEEDGNNDDDDEDGGGHLQVPFPRQHQRQQP